jgi:hypothetical protein
MPRRRALFTKTDLARATSVAEKCGAVVELKPDGTIRIVPSPPTAPDNDDGPDEPNEWDNVK